LRSVLEDSIRAHLISDVPLGAFLSGGIDSSAIVALMSRVAGERPRTFTVVFEESEFSEGEHAKVVARAFGTEHHEILLSEQSLLDLLPAGLSAMDQPTMDGINTYVVSKAVKEAGITVALSGLGGDELFGGYPSFRRAVQLSRLAAAPAAIRQLASAAGRALLNGDARRRKFWDLVESDCSPHAAYAISRRLFAPDEVAALLSAAKRKEQSAKSGDKRFEIRDPKSEFDSNAWPFALSALPENDLVNQVSFLELTGYMANTLLRDTDQMSMAHALEVRVPFIDPAVVSFVLGLPGKWKLDGSKPKPLLLDALTGLLPEHVWRRPKMGFTLPFQRWMTSALEPEVNTTLCRTDLSAIGLSSDSAGVIWKSFNDNPRQEPWSRPWALYVLKKWCEINGVHA
jgi:asparagine synthase (glutamine-hydrolysing)